MKFLDYSRSWRYRDKAARIRHRHTLYRLNFGDHWRNDLLDIPYYWNRFLMRVWILLEKYFG